MKNFNSPLKTKNKKQGYKVLENNEHKFSIKIKYNTPSFFLFFLMIFSFTFLYIYYILEIKQVEPSSEIIDPIMATIIFIIGLTVLITFLITQGIPFYYLTFYKNSYEFTIVRSYILF